MILGILFAVIAVLLSLFISGYGMTAGTHYRFGIRLIYIVYLLGLVLLFIALSLFD